MPDWFGRPIFHVADVEASLLFYVEQRSFTNPWRYEEGGKAHVAQVQGLGCEGAAGQHPSASDLA